MEPDFSTLASRVAAREDVQGCMILSRDGLLLGAFPPGGEDDVRQAWLRLSDLGDVERGFVALAGQVWAFSRRGAYTAVAVAGKTSRPGVVLELLDQVLLIADEARVTREAVRQPDTVNLARGGLRGFLHRDHRAVERIGEPSEAMPRVSAAAAVPTREPSPRQAGSAEDDAPPPAEPPVEEPGAIEAVEEPIDEPEEEPDEGSEEMPEVDRVVLAREFAQLLQEGSFGEEEGR